MIDILTKHLTKRLPWFIVSGTAVIAVIISGSVTIDLFRSSPPEAQLNVDRPVVSENFDFFVFAGEAPDSCGPG